MPALDDIIMEYTNRDALSETDWLAKNLENSDIKIIDCTYAMPGITIVAKDEYYKKHIPGAGWFDINDVADDPARKNHMLPTAEVFAEKVGKLGISADDHVVVYDQIGGMSAAARVWWMFRCFGHEKVSWLNGSFAKWEAENHPITADITSIMPTIYTGKPLNLDLVRSLEQMKENVTSHGEQVIDARANPRFTGEDPGPNPKLSAGHIPGSVNVPFKVLLDPENGTMLPADELTDIFSDQGVNLGLPISNSCGSGVTANIPLLALYLLGNTNAAVYDGSWNEWGAQADTPVETG